MKNRITIPFIAILICVFGFLGFQAINAATYTQPLYGSAGTDTTNIASVADQQAMSVSGSTALMVNGNTIFTIAGGPIKIVDLVSICVTANNTTASTIQYSADPTLGAAVTFSGASATLASSAPGAGVVLNQTALSTAPDISAVMVGLGSVSTNKIIVNEGIITIVIGVGSTTGTWKHYLRYIPLATGVTVTGT